MAGDWIKMRVDLATDPAVIQIAALTGLDEDTVVGKLYRVWAWADAHTTDGRLGCGLTVVDRLARHDGFATAMESVGWLTVDDGGVVLPHFDRHNGKTAKARAQAAKRASAQRQRDGSVTPALRERDGSVTKCAPREEKRREEKTKDPKTQTPPAAAERVTAEDVYSAYPRKVGKADAVRAIESAMRIIDAPTLLAKVREYATSPLVGSSPPRFIPHPATWFRQGRWADDPAEWGQPYHDRGNHGGKFDPNAAANAQLARLNA
jgi:hypothetical protein